MTTTAGDAEVVVDDLREADLDRVTDLHLAAFPASELSRLGREAVRRHYRWQLRGPHDLTALAASTNGELVGYLLGGVFRGSLSGFVKDERWFLLGQVLRHPGVVVRGRGRQMVVLCGRLLLRRPSEAAEQPARVPDGSFGVLVVAVDPDSQRQGIGASLLAAAEDRARAAGFRALHLTLHPGNVAALSFYTDLGWHRLGIPGDDDEQWLIGKDLKPA